MNIRALVFVGLAAFFAGFGQSSADDSKKIAICSTTQVADFTRQIVGDRWEVICVLGAGADPHTYKVRANDKSAVVKADLCIENGWNLEGHDWMKKLAEEAGKPIVTCVDGVSPLQMQKNGATIKDPHAWFDPRNAVIYVRNIRDAVIKVDPANAAEYTARAELYTRQLLLLNGWVKKTVGSIPANRRVLITHHDAFGYFCKAFNFKALSPVGWSTAELGEVTAGRRQEIVKQIKEIGVKAVFVETSTNEQLIEGIASDSGVTVGGTLYSDAMGPDGSAGETYVGMIRENVITIVNALK